MIHVFADAWREGLHVNQEEIIAWRAKERENYAAVMRELKAVIKDLLPFNTALNEEMVKCRSGMRSQVLLNVSS